MPSSSLISEAIWIASQLIQSLSAASCDTEYSALWLRKSIHDLNELSIIVRSICHE